MNSPKEKVVLVIDYGSQYTQIIARRVREIGIYCEIWPYDFNTERLQALSPKGIILSGGPETTTAHDAPKINEQIFELGCPILGICYGMQAMAMQFGGQVGQAEHREFGHALINCINDSKLFSGLETQQDVWMSHGDKLETVPEDFEVIGETKHAPIAAMQHKEKPWYGLQFHPEVTHTEHGKAMLTNFVRDICGCHGEWTLENIEEELIEKIKQQVGDERVVLGLSGGVDSSVAGALLHRAIGENLTCIFVDTGLLRLNEADKVMQAAVERLHMPVIKVDAKERFLNALQGESCPETKRKIIGKLFIDIFDETASSLPGEPIKWLAQGTIYSDVIESAGNDNGKGHVIKSHHNVGGLPEKMNMQLVEPLRDLFKDEVRHLGVALGLPKDLLFCHPFPGPGLAVRVLGEVKAEYVEMLQKADAIFIEALREHDLYDSLGQAFAVFLPVKSVAVMGDGRVYDYVIALRAVQTQDFMTAHWAHLPYDFLGHVSNRIINEVQGISRVTYDISGKPPATIEWE